ncbi:hypothetical protein lerEdw1_012845 [Lerista edwardsae]|nr:hypothetical protein lerEdw1_012845 [Lerista edwardsae]
MSNGAEGPLRAVGVDFLKEQNSLHHRTKDYNISSLAVRRGQRFQLKVTFSREVKDNDRITLRFSIGEKPKQSNGTLLSLKTGLDQPVNSWRTAILQKNGKECLIDVIPSAEAIIGKYLLSVKTGPNIYSPENSFFYLLFNPWCEGDSVFMPNEAERAEYVLNDTGYLYVGSAKNIRERPWNYGQFEESVLDCCMYLLDKSKLKLNSRKDPVIIARSMSALVNSHDDAGVLFGNWSGKYSGGTPPLAWTGSAPILQQYYKNKKTVNFGQCWVFSGVLTTVMRSLGIPARSVTNFASAHDTEENLKVDIYVNESGQKLDHLTNDSIWNFHVWNDVWMKRPDLPKGNDGWQAIDATPQEQSQGIFQCGPSPVNGIRKGDVYLPYDSKFVFAEVNADRIFWLVKDVNGNEKYIKLREETKVIGKSISTKAVGKNTREDITHQYKFPEDSPEERKAVQTACNYLNSCNLGVGYGSGEVSKPNLQFEIEGEKEIWPGQPIDLNIVVKNESGGSWTVKLAGSCQLESYTGKIEASLATIKQTIETEGKPGMYTQSQLSLAIYVLFLVMVPAYSSSPASRPQNAVTHATTCMQQQQQDLAPGRIFKCKIICAPRKTGLKKIVAELNCTQVKGISVEKMISITE